MELLSETQDFFERYAMAYRQFDPSAFADFFSLPCLVVDSSGDHVFNTTQDIESYETPFIASLEAAGLHSIEFEIAECLIFDERECFCSLRYRLFDTHSQLIGDMGYHYVLQATHAGLAIKFARMGQIHHWLA